MPPLTGTALPFPPGGPEALFGVGQVYRDGERFAAEQRTGSWTADGRGGGCAGTLGVLVDDVLGWAVLVGRPAGEGWSVSTEITVDLVAPVPTDGAVLTCTGRVVRHGESGGLARGEVLDERGRPVATATQRQRFVPGDPTATGPRVQPPSGPAGRADALAAIGGELRRHDAGVALTVPGGAAVANPAGNVHGGISLAASELLGALALDDAAAPLVTASVHVDYLRPMPITGPTTYTVEVVHRGRTFGVARVAARSAAGKLCTVATVTGQGAF